MTVSRAGAPLVSVIITTYNTARYVPATLTSALAQTYAPFEVIVVDDGSQDDIGSSVAPFLDRIRFLPERHAGLAAARNRALEVATGDYIALLDSDDLWSPDKLAVQVEIARRRPESGLIACDGHEFGAPASRPFILSGAAARALGSSRREVTGDFHRAFIRHVNIRCPAQTLIPRRVVDRVGPFADFEAQDYEYYLRVSAQYPVTFHADPLVSWRDREEGLSGPRVCRELTWIRQRIVILSAYLDYCEPRFRAAVRRQIAFSRAEAACYAASPRVARTAYRLWTSVRLPRRASDRVGPAQPGDGLADPAS
jgi:glycosyltransferase involved in cell wall biosynthesis